MVATRAGSGSASKQKLALGTWKTVPSLPQIMRDKLVTCRHNAFARHLSPPFSYSRPLFLHPAHVLVGQWMAYRPLHVICCPSFRDAETTIVYPMKTASWSVLLEHHKTKKLICCNWKWCTKGFGKGTDCTDSSVADWLVRSSRWLLLWGLCPAIHISQTSRYRDWIITRLTTEVCSALSVGGKSLTSSYIVEGNLQISKD